jgi:CoA-transferase family III
MVGAKGKRSGPPPAGARELLRQPRRLISPRAGLAMAWGAARLPAQVRRLARQSLAIAYGDGLAGPRASSGLERRALGSSFMAASRRQRHFTTTIAGPHCTRLFAELGAEVVKIEARFSSPSTLRTSSRIFLSGWFAGTRASGAM